MDLEITVSMDAATTIKTLKPILDAAEKAVTGQTGFDETFYGKAEDGGDMIVHFDNEDMERPEMEGQIIVIVGEQ